MLATLDEWVDHTSPPPPSCAVYFGAPPDGGATPCLRGVGCGPDQMEACSGALGERGGRRDAVKCAAEVLG